MYLEIISPDQQLFAGEVSSATFPGKKGSFQVLKDHTALISTLEAGIVKYNTNGKEVLLEVEGGVVEVVDNRIKLLIESAKSI
jgi:F-type H+-transporting ATPase subunit epsilon